MKQGASVTIVSVLALTAGITAAAAAIVWSFVWGALPYPNAERLVVAEYPLTGPSIRSLSSIDADGVSAFADLAAASDPDSFTVSGSTVPFTTEGRWIGADVFPMFGVTPLLGRAFTREDADNRRSVAMLGYEVWRDRFGSRADVIGQTIALHATIRRGVPETFTVVGVLPPRFWHVEDSTGILVPLESGRLPWLLRLREGVSRDEAARRLGALIGEQVRDLPADWDASVQRAQDAHIARVRPMLTAIGWSLLMLAAVAVANLAFLQMARGVARQREIAVHTALGASGTDVVRIFAREGVVHGAIASTIGCSIAALILNAGIALVEQYIGRIVPRSPGTDPRIYGWLIVATLVGSVALSAFAWLASRSRSLAVALTGAASSTDTPTRLLLRQLIVTAQVAVAFCLLVGAALMVRTAWHIGQIDPGFDAANVLSANITLPQGSYRSLEEQRRFYNTLIERLSRTPEIEHAGLTGWLPFRVGPSVTVIPEGGAPDQTTAATLQGTDAGYFAALRIRLREGRFISVEDRSGRATAVVISDTLARELWGEQSALGRAFRVKFSPEPGRGFGPYTVVGVVDDVMQSVVRDTPPQLYLSFYQQPIASNAFLQIRTRVDPRQVAPNVERIVRELDPSLALGSVTTLDELVERDGMRPRLLARALTGFAVLAIAIAVVGLYAVSARIAHLRRREAALRVALGSDRSSVAILLARRGLIAVVAGLAIGWIAAWPLAAVLASEVRGLSSGDLATRLAVAAVMCGISVAALLAPAWRASTANLSTLLREV